MKNNIELKPCPFCGSKDVSIYDNSTDDEEYYMIECNNCNAAVCFGDESETKKGAAKMWNRRVEMCNVNQNGNNCTNISNTGTVNMNLR